MTLPKLKFKKKTKKNTFNCLQVKIWVHTGGGHNNKDTESFQNKNKKIHSHQKLNIS